MFSIEKNKGLYLELCLLLDYIEDEKDLEQLGFYRNLWENSGVDAAALKEIVGLINKYLPIEIECNSAGCHLVNNDIGVYTPINEFSEINYINLPSKNIINF